MPRVKVNKEIKAATRKQIWQRHHLTYEPERTVMIRKGEHWIITQLQRCGGLSKGAKQALRYICTTKYTVETPKDVQKRNRRKR